jgi:aminopeptidase N
VTTEQFIDAAQRISGQDLSAFFQTWLSTTTKPTTW